MNLIEEVENVLQKEANCGLTVLLDKLQSVVNQNVYTTDKVTADIIDLEFLDEVRNLTSIENIPLYFGKTLRDIKFVIMDASHREHTVLIKYIGPKKLVVVSVNLPYSPLQEKEYSSLEEIILAYKKHFEKLSQYFYELERIDKFCTIMEPIEPSFKDDYRRILLGKSS